jgi:hypothetical protein
VIGHLSISVFNILKEAKKPESAIYYIRLALFVGIHLPDLPIKLFWVTVLQVCVCWTRRTKRVNIVVVPQQSGSTEKFAEFEAIIVGGVVTVPSVSRDKISR